MKRIARSAIVPHSAAQLHALVEDIESYPHFLPWCVSAEVKSRGEGSTLATLTVGVRGMSHSFTTRNESRPPEAIDLELVEGPFKQFAAAWRFQPLGEQACKVEFSMQFEFASRALAVLLQPLFERIADSMVDAFTRRADEVHGHAG
ncbi:MAG TPA: type II toxin-antitoxin system RatA family toxin [Burkholderiales bacterium]|nr:type II toxin-antitoxin system RatA family toxin [Burkholderiales bacterium]